MIIGRSPGTARAPLDDLAIDRGNGKPTAPAVFLSGNGPLVQVLQYELRHAGGDGKVFVRDVKDYVRRHVRPNAPKPNEHVIVFDEAQRAWDPLQVAEKHGGDVGPSEPDLIVRFADRIPEWCVILGLVGTGQEIHIGEEAGVEQWRDAVGSSARVEQWTIHVPPALMPAFASTRVPLETRSELALDTELRFHGARRLHEFVAGLLGGREARQLRSISEQLAEDGYHLRLTRSLDTAKQYLRERYRDDPMARFGLIASSKDRDLVGLGIPNDFQSTKRVKMGPWYSDLEIDPGGYSCRHLTECVTEFGSQGLELDAALVAWGTDLVWTGVRWSNDNARGYKAHSRVRDAMQLRQNAYRVLLTRGRDATVLFVPPLEHLNDTALRLIASGVLDLDEGAGVV